MALLVIGLNVIEWLVPDDLSGPLGAFDRQLKAVIFQADSVVCCLFFVDFLIKHVLPLLRWRRQRRRQRQGLCAPADQRKDQPLGGLTAYQRVTVVLLDLVSCIPATWISGHVWRTLRCARRFRLLQAMRVLRATEVIGLFLGEARSLSVAAVVCFFSFAAWLLGGLAVLLCEADAAAPSIRTAGDALWWSAATMTTVGYGDVAPVTAGGRVVALFLMLGGVSVFGAMSGLIASFVFGPNASGGSNGNGGGGEEQQGAQKAAAIEANDSLQADVRALRQEVAALRRLIEESREGGQGGPVEGQK